MRTYARAQQPQEARLERPFATSEQGYIDYFDYFDPEN